MKLHCKERMDEHRCRCTFDPTLYVIYYYCRQCGREDWEWDK